MSAAATAAGYLYASGRLRGRGSREEEAHEPEQKARPARKALKVAVYDPAVYDHAEPAEAQPAVAKKTPKIEYRTRRWKPE